MLTVNIVAIIIENLDGLLTQKMQLEITRNFGKPVFEYIQNVPLYHMSDSNFVADKERAINAVENDMSKNFNFHKLIFQPPRITFCAGVVSFCRRTSKTSYNAQ